MNKKNKDILKIFNIMKNLSILEYEDIDPEEYISVEHFLRIISYKYNKYSNSLSYPETIQYRINRNNYCVICIPSLDYNNTTHSMIYELSKKLVKIDKDIKGWVIDLRSNTGGVGILFMLFMMIFIDTDYNGLLYSIKKDNDEIIHDCTVDNNILYTRNIYQQYVHKISLSNLERVKNKKIKILIDNYSASGAEYVAIILESFGAVIYGNHDKSLGALNLTSSFLIEGGITLYFPNAHFYDKNNLKHNIYLEISKPINKKYLLP